MKNIKTVSRILEFIACSISIIIYPIALGQQAFDAVGPFFMALYVGTHLIAELVRLWFVNKIRLVDAEIQDLKG